MKDSSLKKLETFYQLNLSLIDKEKSSYWKNRLKEYDFRKINAYVNSGTFTKRTIKQKLFHYINQRLYFSKIQGINIFKTNSYKKGLNIAKKQNRLLDYDFLRMVFTYHFITEIKKIKFTKICIIGDGKSTLTSIFKEMHPEIEIYYVNLVEIMIQDYKILSKSKQINDKDHIIVQNENDLNLKKKLYFIPSSNAHFLKNKNIDLFLNTVSFQEMLPDILENYFEIISSNKSILYHCNRIEKKLDDGSITKVKDYPIKNGKIIFNEKCPWHSFDYVSLFKKSYFKDINHYLIDFNN